MTSHYKDRQEVLVLRNCEEVQISVNDNSLIEITFRKK